MLMPSESPPIFHSRLLIIVAFFGKKKRGGARSQHIKPGIQYQWDEESRRWAPVLKRLPSIVTYKSKPPESPAYFSLRWPLYLGFFVTQDFQAHLQTKAEKGYKYYNGGLDLAYSDVREGADVVAAASGVLKSASFSGEGYGNVVYIDHLNGYITIYSHLRGFGFLLNPGHAVEAGDVIGALGHSGNCWGGPGNPDGTHLHFELRLNGVPVDPAPFLPLRIASCPL